MLIPHRLQTKSTDGLDGMDALAAPRRSMEETAREVAAEAIALAQDAPRRTDHPDLIRRRIGHLSRLVQELRDSAPRRPREDH